MEEQSRDQCVCEVAEHVQVRGSRERVHRQASSDHEFSSSEHDRVAGGEVSPMLFLSEIYFKFILRCVSIDTREQFIVICLRVVSLHDTSTRSRKNDSIFEKKISFLLLSSFIDELLLLDYT